MAATSEQRKIMTKPLPEILDEIEESIGLADEAAKNAREAAVEIRNSADMAIKEAKDLAQERISNVENKMTKELSQLRASTEHSIEDATRAINDRIAKLEQTSNDRIAKLEQALNKRLDEIGQVAAAGFQLAELLKAALSEGVLAMDRKISGKDAGTEELPERGIPRSGSERSLGERLRLCLPRHARELRHILLRGRRCRRRGRRGCGHQLLGSRIAPASRS